MPARNWAWAVMTANKMKNPHTIRRAKLKLVRDIARPSVTQVEVEALGAKSMTFFSVPALCSLCLCGCFTEQQ
jgi:hypothetical protein